MRSSTASNVHSALSLSHSRQAHDYKPEAALDSLPRRTDAECPPQMLLLLAPAYGRALRNSAILVFTSLASSAADGGFFAANWTVPLEIL